MAQTEETTNKLVGMLIQILHGEYSDTRELAVVQLVLMGEREGNPLKAFLSKEEELQKDIEILGKPLSWLKTSPKDADYYRQEAEKFREKWGTDNRDDYSRKLGIKGALKTLRILGVQNLEGLCPQLLRPNSDFAE